MLCRCEGGNQYFEVGVGLPAAGTRNLAQLQQSSRGVAHKGGVGIHVGLRTAADLGKAILLL